MAHHVFLVFGDTTAFKFGLHVWQDLNKKLGVRAVEIRSLPSLRCKQKRWKRPFLGLKNVRPYNEEGLGKDLGGGVIGRSYIPTSRSNVDNLQADRAYCLPQILFSTSSILHVAETYSEQTSPEEPKVGAGSIFLVGPLGL